LTRKRVIILVGIAVVPLLAGALIAGASIWHDSLAYVKSTSARVSGTVTQVSAPGTGEVLELPYDVGATVQQGQTLATIELAPQVQLGAATDQQSVRDPVKAPVDGTIIKRFVHVGERTTTGQAIISLVNLTQLYIVADVDESRAPMVEEGQSATVYLRAFDKNVPGQVAGLTPATSDLVTTAPAGQQQSGATPQVPIIVYFDAGNLPVYPGMSADVTISVR